MIIKISQLLFLYLIIFSSSLASAQEPQEVSVTGINWQEKEQLLTYNLSKEDLVKIRVGIYSGPVYRTIVNLEKRPKGQNQEYWDGKDEEDKIDFLKYGKMHFCVGVPIKQEADYVLVVKFAEEDSLDKIIVDVEENAKPLFNKNGAELRVYLDNKLKKIESIKPLPYTFKLKTDDIVEGKHFLVINLWEALDFNSVAYKSFEISIPEKKTRVPASYKKGKIVFSQPDKNGFWQIFTSTLKGKNIKQLTNSVIDKRYPCWSADGKKIAYVNNLGELWIMEDNGKNNRKIPLPINCSEPKFSPDGKQIIFTSLEDVYHGSTKIWEVDIETLKLKKLVNRPWLQYNPNYSPDMTQVIFTDGPELFGQNILKLNLGTGDITQLTDNDAYDYDMQASYLNSGQQLVYASNESGRDYEIWFMDKFGRDKKNLSRSPQGSDIIPQVSKDDGKIFFLSDRTGKFAIWQMNMDGTEQRQIISSDTDILSFSVYTN